MVYIIFHFWSSDKQATSSKPNSMPVVPCASGLQVGRWAGDSSTAHAPPPAQDRLGQVRGGPRAPEHRIVAQSRCLMHAVERAARRRCSPHRRPNQILNRVADGTMLVFGQDAKSMGGGGSGARRLQQGGLDGGAQWRRTD
jgi:hypothetical protein